MEELLAQVKEEHHHHEHDENCTCGCHDHDHDHHHEHHHDEECGCHDHHHEHHHDEECGCHDHDHDHDHEHHHEHSHEHHHHEHDENCTCGCHDHDHHHHHHADEVFSSWGLENVDACSREALTAVLEELAHGSAYGTVLRSKGMIPSTEPGEWLYFDLVPEEYEIRTGAADYTGKVCVIGSNLNEEALSRAFGRK